MQNEKFIIFCQVLTHCLLSPLLEICVCFLMKAIWQSGVCYLCSAPLCPNQMSRLELTFSGKGVVVAVLSFLKK